MAFDHNSWNPTGRFTGLASLYARSRPGYPEEALDFIQSHCGLGARSLLVDIGSGTGISSRLFAARGVQVIGIEPNADMRAQAEKDAAQWPCETLRYQDGTAEATNLGERAADGVVAAQAFHWFNPEATLAEFHRILKPEGWTILLWNERDETDPLTAAYGQVIRSAPDTAAVEGPRGLAGHVLLAHPLFHYALRRRFLYSQTLNQEGLIGRAFSASYAPRDGELAKIFARQLAGVFSVFQRGGTVTLRYETTVYVGQKKEV